MMTPLAHEIFFLSALNHPPWAAKQRVCVHSRNAGAGVSALLKFGSPSSQIEALVSKGYLDRQHRDDVTATGAALKAWFPTTITRINRHAGKEGPPSRLSDPYLRADKPAKRVQA